MRRWTWRAPLWATLLALALSALMTSAGVWQLRRGFAKQALLDEYAASALAAPQAVDRAPPGRYDRVIRVRAEGRYEPARQLLLDNQGLDGRPGYHVWTVLRLDAGGLVMVDRGWIPRKQGQAGQGLEVDAEARALSGYWQALPRPGLRLAAANCAGDVWPRVVQYPTAEDLECLYHAPLAPGLLKLDPAEPDGYVRRWSTAPEMTPSKHYGYAAQWFAFTLTLIAIVLKLSLRRLP